MPTKTTKTAKEENIETLAVTKKAVVKKAENISQALFTLSGIIFISSLVLAGTIYAGAKMLENKLSSIPDAPANTQAVTGTAPAAPSTGTPTGQDTSLSYIGGSLAVNSAAKPTGTTPDIENVPFVGNKDAKVTIVEYSDYECPFCKKFYDQTIKQLEKEYISTGKVKFIYKDFPLHSIHPLSLPAANAARCAGAQNKYYEMHNALFETYNTWTEGSNLKDSLTTVAKNIGVNTDTFSKCLTDFTYKDAIEKDYTEGYYLGVRGTPTTFINGKMVTTADGDSAGAMDYSMLKAEIDKLL
ncbi:MAG: DsbA family protein [Candidatus Gracilibacteria bacterium]